MDAGGAKMLWRVSKTDLEATEEEGEVIEYFMNS